MRIAISGTHSTGKTSLLNSCHNELIKHFKDDVSVINEVARGVIARGFPLNQEATCDSYYNYILDQLKEERTASTKHVLSDRSLVDLLAYIRTNANPYIPHYFLEMVEEIIWLESGFFDLYCYLPIEIPLVIDDVRPADIAYQQAVDRELLKILLEYRVPFETISGSHSERNLKVLSFFGINEAVD